MTVQVKEYQPQDAAAVARLYRASDPAWPDGFVDNVLLPTEAIEREMAEENVLNTYLAWEDNKAVGFVNLIQIPDDEKAGYVGLLTSDPDYHGRGVGRDLIRRCIDRAVELGHTRITLGTWPGNTKAVPLYKKSGFHWGPDQTGWNELQNHVPLLLAHPLTKSYFEMTDWYACYKRDLSLGLDTQQRNNTLVFPYEWDSTEGTLRAVFDQRTKKLVELDTPDLLLALDVAQAEMLRGKEQLATLRALNKTNEPLTIAVVAKDDGSVKAQHYEVLSVPAGGTGTVQVKLTADAEKADYGAASLQLLINGHPLDMAATVRVLPALELQFEPESPVLRADQSASATLNLHNRTDEVMDVRLLMQPSVGLVATLADEHLNLNAGEIAGIPIELRAAGGVYPVAVSPVVKIGDQATTHPSLKTEVVAIEPGQVQVTRKEDETLLFTDDLLLSISHKEPSATFRERRSGRALLNQWFVAGPPYWPSPLDDERAEVSIRQEAGRVSLTLRSNMKGMSGLRFERTIAMHADNKVTMSAKVANLSGEERTVSIRYATSPADDQPEDAAYLPLPEGVVRGTNSLPGYRWDGPGSEPPLTARWIALDREGWTFGILWPDGLTPRCNADSWMRLALRGPATTIGLGELTRFEEVTLLPTLGGWQIVEREWREQQRIAHAPSKVLPAAGARLVPAPLLLLDDPVTAEIEARYIHPRAESATVQAATEPGFSVNPTKLECSEVSSVGSPTESVTVTPTATRCAAEISLEMQHPGLRGRFTAPMIALGSSRGNVRVEETTDQGEAVWRVANGWLSFGVRPGVLGIVYTLSSPDGEHLYSNFPVPRERWWNYPVYGGIHPVLWERGGWGYDNLGHLAGLTMQAEPTRREGKQSIPWEGLRLWADLEHEKVRGLRFEVEYLTVPQSNVIAVLATLRSTGPARAITYRLEVSPSVEPEMPLLVLPDQENFTRGGMRGGASPSGQRWISAEYPESGRNLVLVGTPGGAVDGRDMGTYGVSHRALLHTVVPPNGAVRSRNYIVLANDRHQAALYATLADLEDL